MLENIIWDCNLNFVSA